MSENVLEKMPLSSNIEDLTKWAYVIYKNQDLSYGTSLIYDIANALRQYGNWRAAKAIEEYESGFRKPPKEICKEIEKMYYFKLNDQGKYPEGYTCEAWTQQIKTLIYDLNLYKRLHKEMMAKESAVNKLNNTFEHILERLSKLGE